jgi:hypothetical protein
MSEETMDLMKNMIHIWFLHMTVEKKKKMLKLQDIRYCCSEIEKRGTANKSDVYKAYKRRQNCFWMLDFCSWYRRNWLYGRNWNASIRSLYNQQQLPMLCFWVWRMKWTDKRLLADRYCR